MKSARSPRVGVNEMNPNDIAVLHLFCEYRGFDLWRPALECFSWNGNEKLQSRVFLELERSLRSNTLVGGGHGILKVHSGGMTA